MEGEGGLSGQNGDGLGRDGWIIIPDIILMRLDALLGDSLGYNLD